MQQDTPNYADWTRADLITETTRLALAVEEAENRGWDVRALLMRERYHLAMAELISKSADINQMAWGAQGAEARQRAQKTRNGHMQQAAIAQRQRLGMTEGVPA